MKSRALIVFLTVAVACMAGWTVYAQRRRAATPEWEYRVMFDPATASFTREASFDKGVKDMDLLGAEGWELVGINNTEHGTMLYFKRAK